MPRTLSAPLLTELAKTITSVGYLVQVNASSIMRWSNIGDITWNSLVWADVDFSVDGLVFDSDIEQRAALTVQNLDNALGAVFLLEAMPDVVVTIWQFTRGALAVGDVPKIAVMAIDGCDIGIDAVKIQLVEQSSLTAFSPRRRVDSTFGMSYGMPEGTVIPWENERFVAEPSDG